MFGINDCSKLTPPTLSLCCLVRNSLGYSYGNFDQISDVVNIVILLACSVGRSMRHRLCNCRFCTLNGKREGYVTRVDRVLLNW